jgi:hypothetical protein
MISYTLTEINSGEVHKDKDLHDAADLILRYDGRTYEVRRDKWGYVLWCFDRYGWRRSALRSYEDDQTAAVEEIYRKVLDDEAFLTEYEVEEASA